jgi:hypothetical protein
MQYAVSRATRSLAGLFLAAPGRSPAKRRCGKGGAVYVGLAAHSGSSVVLTSRRPTVHLAAENARTSRNFTIFDGTSEIQRMIIGRAVTGLDVR